ncbi:MAG: hypothetical protein WBX01_03660 [Nitrososphaeraceae archaeon]|jgi:hypothetical protein
MECNICNGTVGWWWDESLRTKKLIRFKQEWTKEERPLPLLLLLLPLLLLLLLLLVVVEALLIELMAGHAT